MVTLSECCICKGSSLIVADDYADIQYCQTCDYYFDNPRPSSAEIDNFYSTPDQYDEWLGEEDARDRLWSRRLKLVLRHSQGGAIYDIGSGVGQFLYLAKKHFSSVGGSEVSQSAIDIARSKYELELDHRHFDLVYEEAEEKVDNVTLFHVLEHVQDPAVLMKSCNGMLNDGGFVFVAVPNDVECFRARIKRLALSFGLNLGKSQHVGSLGLPKVKLDGSLQEIHLSHFTVKCLKNLFAENGFDVVSISPDPYYVASLIREPLSGIRIFLHGVVMKLFSVNLYETTFIVGRKNRNIRVDM